MTKIINFFTKPIVALLIILLVAFFLRTYRLEETALMNHDEATNLLQERRLLTTLRPTFLGSEDNIAGTIIYYGPVHYYLMAPALKLANYNPFGTYYWMAILGTIAVLLVYLCRRSLVSAAFLAVFPVAVVFNRSDWMPNGIFFFTAIFIFFLSRKRFFFAGMAAAFAFQCHITAGVLFLTPLFFCRRNLVSFFIGVVLGLSPLILFDLKNHFLYFGGYLNLFLHGSPGHNGFEFHYFFWLIPIVAVLMTRLPKKLSLLIVGFSFLVSLWWLKTTPTEVARNPKTIAQVSQIIAQDATGKVFNVASFVDPNTRAMAYRYFLNVAGVDPLGVDQYPQADTLYVITYERPEVIMATSTYEVASFAPKRVTKTWQVAGENIYRLEK